MAKKLFLKFSILLFVLSMSTNVAWAGAMLDDLQTENPEAYAQIMTTLGSQLYCARLTGHASSTGGGKVYVNLSDTQDPRDATYEEGTSNVAVVGMGMSMAGMTQMPLAAWAKADEGYYLAGWSYANMGTDLGTASSEEQPNMYYAMYDIGIVENETVDHVIYATFEPIRFAGYTISGNNTTSKPSDVRYCEQTVTFTMEGTEIDAADFKAPVVTSVVGGGSWTSADGDAWTTADLTIDGNNVSLEVKFTAPDDAVADYSANLVMETQSGVKMNIPLNARTASTEDVEAIRYNKNKVKQGQGTLTEMINAAQTDDIIKLNKNISGTVTTMIAGGKTFTLDLNGYNITKYYTTPGAETDMTRIANATLLINNAGGEVTLAYSPFGGKIVAQGYNDAIDILGGKLILNGDTIESNFFGIGAIGAEVVVNGATISGNGCAIASMDGTLTIKDGMMYGLVGSMSTNEANTANLILDGGTIDNSDAEYDASNTGIALQIGSGVATLNRGTLIGRIHALNTAGNQGLATTVNVAKNVILKSVSGEPLLIGGGTTTIDCAKFDTPANLRGFQSPATAEANLIFKSAYFLDDNGQTIVEGKHLWRNTSGAEFREGYKFFAGDLSAAQNAGVSVCHIGGTSYSKLEDALAYANNTDEQVMIIMDNDYTLPAGYYTLPANAKLLVPMSNEQGAETKFVTLDYGQNTPAVFRKLILEDGVNLDVFGTIEVSGSQYSGDDDHTGATSGAYGQLQLNQGSKITLQNGSILRAWGYVTGDIEHKNAQHNVPMGEIDARRGATVYELFQMGDWGATIANGIGLVANDSYFPISSYYIQNIETPVKYHPGAQLLATTTVSASGGGLNLTMCANDIKIIGVSQQDVAMFLMDAAADAENTWVRKWYDASKDQQVYEINSGAHIGNLVINLASSPLLEGMENMLAGMDGPLGLVGGIAQGMGAHFEQDLIMNSGQYVLPITSNFKLHVLTGTLDFTQSTELIPGSELEIDKEATMLVTDQGDPDVLEGSLYIFDWRDWAKPAQKVAYTPVFDDGIWGGAVPDEVRNVSSIEALGSAKVNVHGTFDTDQGYVFTSEHGGNIFSSIEDAGTFMFTNAAKAVDYKEEVKITTGFSANGLTGQTTNCYPAYLKNSAEWVANGGDEYVHTGGTEAGQSYCYLDIDGRGGHWMSLEQRGCFTYDDGQDVYYIKPQEYVAVTVNAVWDGVNKEFTSLSGNSDHTFSDAAGKGRLFILLTDGIDCQWWEVEAKDNYFHCIHPENDTYYEWDGDHNEWKEVEFTITWKDWDGNPIKNAKNEPIVYQVPYGTQAEWLSTNPTREKTVDYTYDFTGWSPALGKVTSDVTYTATYEAKQIKYTITFVNDGGMEIERHLLARNEMPVCENVPTRTGYILEWSPALAAVTGNQTYTATWLPEPPTTYAVTFADYDGTVLKKNDASDENAVFDVDINGTISNENLALVPTPTKKQIDQQALNNKEYNYVFDHWQPAVTDPVTQPTIYTAVYREEAKTYTVIFQNEDGSQLESYQYAWGETPVCSVTPTKANTAQYTYSFAWTPQIQTVQGAATYRATFSETTNKYTVTLRCNLPGACTFTGAGIYDYGQSATISATINDPSAYEFVQWTTETTHSFGAQTITEDLLITVMVKQKNQTPDNLILGVDGEQNVSSATNYMDVIITSDGISASSQIINANNITLYGNADFVLQKTFAGSTWYCVAVPWRVDVNGGILLDGTTPAVLGKNMDICYYDGSVRAAQGKVDACWVYMRNLGASQRVLQPGRAYMIALKDGASSITFRKKAQEPLLTTGTTVQQYNSMTGDDADAGWNAIANPSLFHAYINAGADGTSYGSYVNYGQVYNDGAYTPFDMEHNPLVVGQPIYVQVPAAKSVVANNSSYAAAPARRANGQVRPTSFEVMLNANGTSFTDKLMIRLNEDKEENTYVIGQDLVKFGVSSKVAQMWIDRYDAKLCVNTIAPEGDATNFPMSIFAPKAGEYTIAIEREVANEDDVLYLTYNGEAIWNLSEGAYVLNLNKGTDNKYGLRVSARAPQITTGIDEAVVDAKGDTRKVLINNQVFIIRGDKVYSVDGQLVK